MKYPKKTLKRDLSGYTPYEFREGELIEKKSQKTNTRKKSNQ